MGRHSAWIAPSYAAVFVAGVVAGCWLRRPREAPKLRAYDRELASEAEAAKWRAQQRRNELERRRGRGGNTA